MTQGAFGPHEDWHDSLMSRRFLWLKTSAALYVIAIPVSHYALPHSMVWGVALFFLVAMLFTYPAAAFAQGAHRRRETAVSLGLAALGVIGFVTSPWLIVAAIAGHGLWDTLKHRWAHGAQFFTWYVSGCAAVDFSYAAALSVFVLFGETR